MVNFIAFIVILCITGSFIALLVWDGLNQLWGWYKTGFCRHEWKLYSTCSFGSKHRYKCEKCKSERLR